MAKHKRKHLESKRKRFETKGQSKAGPATTSSNPFEFHRNKVKHSIIGRKVAKNEVGNKGLSRNRAFNKRKDTLLHEYKRKHKSGRGVQDLRNDDSGLTNHWKSRNLSIEQSFSDGPQLTHRGKHLNDFMDDTIGSDDDDIDVFNRPEFVESAHFGGGTDGRPKSANEVLDQIMDEKREKQLERAANVELTQKLDTEWSAIKNILRHKGVQHQDLTPKEDFDILVKELMFESRTKPSTSVATLVQQTKAVAEPNVQKSSNTLFKEIVEQIEQKTDWNEVKTLLSEAINNIIPQINEESISLLVDKYQTIGGTKHCFSAQNFAFLLLGTFFRETKPIVSTILAKLLSNLRLKTVKDISIGLVLTKTMIMSLSDKYIPEVFVTLLNIIRLTEKPNDSNHKSKTNLYLEEDSNEDYITSFDPKFAFGESIEKSKLNEKQIKVMLTTETIRMIEQMMEHYSTFPSLLQMMVPFKCHFSRLSAHSVKNIREMSDKLLIKLNSDQLKSQMSSLVSTRPKPFILPMFEPKFDTNTSSLSKKNPKKKLVKKYKRELKGAQRELRKDSTFMRNTWIDEIQVNDKRRKDKVKEIMGDLAQQQGLYKKKNTKKK